MTKIIEVLGGATIKKGAIKNYKSGFQVCVNSKEKTFKSLIFALKFAQKEALKSFGLWKDNGLWYLDTNSIRVATKKEALKLAKEHNQVAVWNWRLKKSVYVS
jgi:phosphopantetheinyl transferase (holo-ACP synthase)